MSAVVGFSQSLERHPPGLEAFPFAWVESPREARLDWVEQISDWRDPQCWPSGRVFGETGEYRWQQLANGQLHAVFMLDSGSLPKGFEGELKLKKIEDRDLELWGDWVDPDQDPESNPDRGPKFYARDLPRVQSYPLSDEGQFGESAKPRLAVRCYQAEEKGEGAFERCMGVCLFLEGDTGVKRT